MNYVLNDNVYLVLGEKNGCIYDFNNGKLYAINSELSKKMNDLNMGELQIIDEELNTLFLKMCNIGILKESTELHSQIIDEIYRSIECDMAWIEVTTQCNLKCKHCYNESSITRNNTMSIQDFQLAVDSLIALNIRKIQLIGGEPLICKETIKDMLEYCVGKFDYIEIFTNGTLIDSDLVNYFAQNDIHIALSVYSYDSRMHDNVTMLEGTWEKTNNAIKMLYENGVNYRISTVLINSIEIGDKNTDLYTIDLSKDIVRMSGRANIELLSDDLLRKKLITKDTFKKPITKAFCSRLLSGNNCFNNKIYISADLDVYPCVMERRIKHCNIKDNGKIVLDDIIRKYNKNCIDECKCCEYRYACFDCRPNTINGLMTEKPWYCTYMPKEGAWMNADIFIHEFREKFGY